MRVKVGYRQASKENYNLFILEHPNVKLSFVEFQNIIYSFNYGFRDHLLETGNKGKLPWGFGDFVISKKKPKRTKILEDGREIITLPIDWQKTKITGKKIYHFNFHTDGYKFKWKWFIKSARFSDAEIWSFKPSRITSRLLKHYLTEDNQQKYLEWELLK